MQKKDVTEWATRISRAPNAAQVLALANEFLIRLPLALRAFLPKDCNPRELKSAEDLNDYAYRLRITPSIAGTEADKAQQQIAAVMGQAAQRMAQLMAAQRGAASPNPSRA